jgi:hypothetical protein
MNRNKILNLNFKYDSDKDLTKRPIVEDYDNTTLYMYDLEKHLELTYINPLKLLILSFINEWTGSIYKNLTSFKKISLKNLPSNEKSLEYMKTKFNDYNLKFNLSFVYDEKLFTTFNVLFFLKNMLDKVNMLLYKEKTEDDKIYTIIYKKK